MNDRLRTYTSSAVSRRKQAIDQPSVRKRYIQDDPFPPPDEDEIAVSNLQPDHQKPILIDRDLPQGKIPESDFRAAEYLYRYLGEMNRAQAADERLWAYLTHHEFWDYVQWRWPVEPEKHDVKKRIRSHWFLLGSGLAALRRNALARLWWAAHLTVAPWERNEKLKLLKKENRFHYTRVLLNTQKTYQALTERKFGSNLKVRICCLDVIDRHTEFGPVDPFVRTFMRRVNMLSTHTELTVLSPVNLLKELEAITPEPDRPRKFASGSSL